MKSKWEWVQLWILLPLFILVITIGAIGCSQDLMGVS